jgi:hypothetical protein
MILGLTMTCFIWSFWDIYNSILTYRIIKYYILQSYLGVMKSIKRWTFLEDSWVI